LDRVKWIAIGITIAAITMNSTTPRKIYRFRRLDQKTANLFFGRAGVNKCLLGSMGRLKKADIRDGLTMTSRAKSKGKIVEEAKRSVRGAKTPEEIIVVGYLYFYTTIRSTAILHVVHRMC
jgi:hypothetical protein